MNESVGTGGFLILNLVHIFVRALMCTETSLTQFIYLKAAQKKSKTFAITIKNMDLMFR